MSQPTDLFGNPAGPAQLSLFGAGDDRLSAPPQRFTPDPETVRARLHALLATARAAAALPWPEREARMWTTVFPNMATWLPDDEANQLRLDFAAEMTRLRTAA